MTSPLRGFILTPFLILTVIFCSSQQLEAASVGSAHTVTIAGSHILFDGVATKVIGVRLSNALISEEKINEAIANLDVFKSYGINTVTAYLMGSRWGNIKGYNPDASLNGTYVKRFERLIEEADKRSMIVLVGCLYWSQSEAKADLTNWTQKEANLAVVN